MKLDVNRATLAKPLLAAAIAVIGWYPAASFADDASINAYRCSRLGDTSQCRTPAPEADVRVETRIVLGPYGRYLVQRGESREAALIQAQAIGEHAIERTSRVTKRDLSQQERYQRVISGLTTSDSIEETLSEVAIDARGPAIASLR